MEYDNGIAEIGGKNCLCMSPFEDHLRLGIWWRRSNPMRRSLPVRGDLRTWCLMVKEGLVCFLSSYWTKKKEKKQLLLENQGSWTRVGTLSGPFVLITMSLPQLLKKNLYLYFGNGIATIRLSIFYFLFFLFHFEHFIHGQQNWVEEIRYHRCRNSTFSLSTFFSSLSYFWLNFGNSKTEI